METHFKKKAFAVVVSLLCVGTSSYLAYTNYQNYSMAEKTESDLLLSNVEALANNEHSGGLANSYCPIWNVTIETGGGVFTIPKVTCTTGGEYKCKDGKCPHEK